MNNSKVAIAVSKTVAIIQMLIGVFVLFMFGLCTIMYLSDGDFRADVGFAFLVVCIMFDALGFILINLSRKRNRLIKDFKKYVSYISTDPTGSIDNIAASMNTSVDVVKSNMELMIKRNYFVNAHIDANTNCIIIGSNVRNNNTTIESNMNQTSFQQSTPQIQYVPVACKCCGGMNKIAKGSTAECDFCGSPIQS
jgi:hypothetical protein